MLEISSIIYDVAGAMMCLSALLVITHRQPVYAILFLVKAIVCASILWMILSAEFLSLALIFVYVGAVMTLFLFITMMLNVTVVRDRFWRSPLSWLGEIGRAHV
jgi:NADH-quinone oxidoreductase subunit J